MFLVVPTRKTLKLTECFNLVVILTVMVNQPETQTSALLIKLIHLSALPIVEEPERSEV